MPGRAQNFSHPSLSVENRKTDRAKNRKELKFCTIMGSFLEVKLDARTPTDDSSSLVFQRALRILEENAEPVRLIELKPV